MKNNTLKEIAAVIKKHKKFFVAGHQNPDGDSMGSTLAVTSVLRRMGKTVYAHADSLPGPDLAFLPALNSVHLPPLPKKLDYDVAIFLECSDKKRGGNLDEIFSSGAIIVNIDHHITGEFYGDYNYIDAKASSTAEIIFQLFESMKTKLEPKEATCLYTGLATDTGRFVHSNTTAEAFRVAAGLVSAGADIKKINKEIYYTRSYAETKISGRALEKMQLLCGKKLSVITLTKEDFETFGADPSHTQGIVSQPIMIPGVEVSILIKEERDKVSVNLRSSGSVDVSAIAQQFGGGGHARAAGFKTKDKNLAELTVDLLQVSESAINDAA